MFEFLDFISTWLNETIYTFFVDATAYVFSTLILLWWKLQIGGLEFAWDIAKGVIQALGLNTYLQNAWAAIPAESMAGLQFFRVPESVNLLLTAGMTRLVMKFTPGL